MARDYMHSKFLIVFIIFIFTGCNEGGSGRQGGDTLYQKDLEGNSPSVQDGIQSEQGFQVVNGYKPTPEESKSVGVIYMVDLGGIDFSCTGTLIDKRIVLTAAHCLTEPKDGKTVPLSSGRVFFRVGRIHDLSFDLSVALPWWQNPSNQGVRDAKVSKVVPHPKYDADTVLGPDVGIIYLEDEPRPRDQNGTYLDIPKNDPNLTMRIPHVDFVYDQMMIGRKAFVRGFGMTNIRSDIMVADSMMESTALIRPYSVCLKNVQWLVDNPSEFAEDWSAYLENSYEYCAIGKESFLKIPERDPKKEPLTIADFEGVTDTCQGDSGGPLFTKEVDGEWIVGLTSWGEGPTDQFGMLGCGGFASFYAKLSNWEINQWLYNDLKLDPSKVTGVPVGWKKRAGEFYNEVCGADEECRCKLFDQTSRNSCEEFSGKPLCRWNAVTYTCRSKK